ncbi:MULTISPECIES: hypothetical protein [unclassified Burkholderia]|nr:MULTISPECIES: hypothetical protein [unclassified Burkholderia]KVG44924.1 hypothetical protein WS77_07050 [Burkholderia sp. MSMB0265]KVG89912.1 hypothetical protein WS81_19285 [Burkholderia sp. MSMB2040]KVG96049.1 hypothetical protein WS82_02460 [Burkholderia sp. MSMB2041]KVG99676.1 hypothetical protein WS83_24495 [Burkholderia sp. MSMB2042]
MKKEGGSANRPANESRPLREDDTAARRGIRRRVRKAVRRATRWSPAPIRKSRCRRNGRRTARRSRAALQQAGWQTPHASPAGAALRPLRPLLPLLPLLPQVRADRLAALPKFSEGESARLAFVHTDPRHAGSRLVLRLRRSHHAVSGVSRHGAPNPNGAPCRETLYRPAQPLTLATSRDAGDPAIPRSRGHRRGAVGRRAHRDTLGARRQLRPWRRRTARSTDRSSNACHAVRRRIGRHDKRRGFRRDCFVRCLRHTRRFRRNALPHMNRAPLRAGSFRMTNESARPRQPVFLTDFFFAARAGSGANVQPGCVRNRNCTA